MADVTVYTADEAAQQSSLDIFTSALTKRVQEEGYSFDPKDPEAVWYQKAFPLFLDELDEFIRNEFSQDKDFLRLKFAHTFPISKADVTKNEFRKFFNALIDRMVYDLKEDYGNEGAYLEVTFPRFRVSNEDDPKKIDAEERKRLEKSDQKVVEFLLGSQGLKALIQFDAYLLEHETVAAAGIKEKDAKEGKDVNEQESEKEKKEERYDYESSPRTTPTKEVGGEMESNELPQAQVVQNQPPRNLTNDEALKEGFTLSQVSQLEIIKMVEFNLINNKFVEGFLLEEFPSEIEGNISGAVAEAFKEHARELSQYFTASGSLSIQGKIFLNNLVLSELNTNVYFKETIKRVQQTRVQSNQRGAEKKQFTSIDLAAIAQAPQKDQLADAENFEKTYTEIQKKAFKDQLKQILAYSTLTSNESVENIVNQILAKYPTAITRGLSGIDRFELEQMLPPTAFSVNAEAHKKFLDQIDAHLKSMGTRKKFSVAFDKKAKNRVREELHTVVSDILASSAVSESSMEGAVDNIFRSLEKSGPHLSREELLKAFPDIKLDKEGKNKLADLLERTIQETPIDSNEKRSVQTLILVSNLKKDSRHALSEFLRIYGKDGYAQVNLVNLLDSYALSMAGEGKLNEFLFRIDPSLEKQPALVNFLKNYMYERKQDFASYTKNKVITYSFPIQKEQAIPQDINELQNLMWQLQQGGVKNADRVVAHVYFTRDLAITPPDASDEEIRIRQTALEIRNQLISNLENMDEETRTEYARRLKIDRNNYATQQEYNEAVTTQAIASQGWNAPQSGDTTAWLDKFQKVGKLRADAMKKLAGQIANTVKKYALPAVGVAGAGLGAGAVAAGLLHSFGSIAAGVGGGFGGAAGGAAIGFAVGGPIGALIGGFAGGLIGAVTGFFASGGTANLTGASAAIKSGTGELARQAATMATEGGKIGVDVMAKTLTTSTATIPAAATTYAVSGSVIGSAILSTMTISMILSAFLPDASTVQVAPYYSLDIQESRYITVKKTANPNNSANPTQITYNVEISKKSGVPEVITIQEITDQMSVVNKEQETIDPPALPADLTSQLTSYQGQVLEIGQPIKFTFTVDASGSQYQDSLVRNDVKVKFKANDDDEESAGRAQTCFGDCPQTVVPPCWPTKGLVTQPPYATGPRSNPTINPDSPRGWTHFQYHSDAYDIGGVTLGQEIYAAAPGEVIFAGWNDDGFGNLVIIDHGGWQSYYAHMIEGGITVSVGGPPVQGGDLIGHVDSTGNSSGDHLHYEIRGTTDYVLIDTFGISNYTPQNRSITVPTEGPSCREYYAR